MSREYIKIYKTLNRTRSSSIHSEINDSVGRRKDSISSASSLRDLDNEPFSRLVLVQQLIPDSGSAVWVIKCSHDGKYLAIGGQDHFIKIFILITEKTDEERLLENDALVYRQKVFKTFQGHSSDILDLSWSKNNFLLSASMDKTVRLWHVARRECLCVFQHLDFVPSVAFHPKDDRFFLSGSLDRKIRLWSIPEKRVVYWNELSNDNMVTAVGFAKQGKMCIAGTYNGQSLMFETEGLKQVGMFNSKYRKKQGKKITGLEISPGIRDEKILVSSNDSRIRLFNTIDGTIKIKFKGYQNQSSQIKASFHDSGKYIIAGSEDQKVYIWNTEPDSSQRTFLQVFKDSLTREKSIITKNEKYISFEASNSTVTCAIFAPLKSLELLERNGFREAVLETLTTATSNTVIKSHLTCTDGYIIITADYNGCVNVYENLRCGGSKIIKPSNGSINSENSLTFRSDSRLDKYSRLSLSLSDFGPLVTNNNSNQLSTVKEDVPSIIPLGPCKGVQKYCLQCGSVTLMKFLPKTECFVCTICWEAFVNKT